MSRIAFFEGFADAKDQLQTDLAGFFHLGVDDGVGFTKNRTTLAVTDDHVANENLAQHFDADFSGVGTIIILRAVLGGHFHTASFEKSIAKGRQRNEGRGDDDVTGLTASEFAEE